MKVERFTTALVASLLISGGFTYLLGRTIKAHGITHTAPDLLYAAPSRPLQAGEMLKPDAVEMVPWPASKPLSGAFPKSGDVVGRAVLFPLEKGEPILDRDVSAVGSGIGLATRIPEGMRAIALRSDEVAGVAGFLNPGSHVDVLFTFHSGSSPDPITVTALQDAAVLAVGQRTQPDPEGKPTSVTVVTLLLTPAESERAVLASTQGTIHFVLRNAGDRSRPENAPVLLSMLSGALPQVTQPRVKTASLHASAPVSAGIETVLGNETAADKSPESAQP